MFLDSGVLELTKEDSYFCLYHGGGGPADPKNSDFTPLHQSLEAIYAKLQSQKVSPVSFTAHGLTEPHTQAEKIALLTAKLLEKDPLYNAGFGAALQEDGVPRVSASFMESIKEKFSSVSNLEGIVHPVELAYFLQNEKFCLLDSKGGHALSEQLKVPRENLITEARLKRWKALKEVSS